MTARVTSAGTIIPTQIVSGGFCQSIHLVSGIQIVFLAESGIEGGVRDGFFDNKAMTWLTVVQYSGDTV